MIVSASYRTDIPAFYGRWFRRRLADGVVRVANPYGGPATTVSLLPGDVDGFVFWTRNAAPFMDALDDVAARGIPFTVLFTITAYPRALDAATIAWADAAEQVRTIAARYGPRVAVWRYDPIIVSSPTPAAEHRRRFAEISERLEGAVDESVVSFAQVYRKTTRNMDIAARRHGFTWRDPPNDEKTALLRDLADIAADRKMSLSLCAQRELLIPGVADAACVDVRRLSDVAGKEITARRRAHRDRCGCWASRDIGAYDTCPHGCAYCYAVRDRATAKRRFHDHDPDCPSLIPGTTDDTPARQGNLFNGRTNPGE